jgi:hypothetical protein
VALLDILLPLLQTSNDQISKERHNKSSKNDGRRKKKKKKKKVQCNNMQGKRATSCQKID